MTIVDISINDADQEKINTNIINELKNKKFFAVAVEINECNQTVYSNYCSNNLKSEQIVYGCELLKKDVIDSCFKNQEI